MMLRAWVEDRGNGLSVGQGIEQLIISQRAEKGSQSDVCF